MVITYNKIGAERKALVEAISEITGEEKKYQGVPSLAYKIGDYTVDKVGNVDTGTAESEKVESLIKGLAERGFVTEIMIRQIENEPEEILPSETVAEEEHNPDEELEYAVSMPKKFIDDVTLEKLKAIIAGKESLIKKALGAESLEIIEQEDTVRFPWFTLKDDEAADAKAYSAFIQALCKMANEAKRVNAKEEKDVPNEKYAFRCFLLRLGFIGQEYKNHRKVLLRNLEGSSAFRTEVKENETESGNN